MIPKEIDRQEWDLQGGADRNGIHAELMDEFFVNNIVFSLKMKELQRNIVKVLRVSSIQIGIAFKSIQAFP